MQSKLLGVKEFLLKIDEQCDSWRENLEFALEFLGNVENSDQCRQVVDEILNQMALFRTQFASGINDIKNLFEKVSNDDQSNTVNQTGPDLANQNKTMADSSSENHPASTKSLNGKNMFQEQENDQEEDNVIEISSSEKNKEGKSVIFIFEICLIGKFTIFLITMLR